MVITIDEMIPIIKNNIDLFPNYGGDMTTLFACCKKTHSKRLLSIPTELELINSRKHIILIDVINGIILYKNIKEKSFNDNEEHRAKYINMYT